VVAAPKFFSQAVAPALAATGSGQLQSRVLHRNSPIKRDQRDPDSSVVDTGEKRRPMVGIALETYRRRNK
jgi:hypothetical protein